MFTLLGWFLTVLIVLAALAGIGWCVFWAYIHLSVAKDPEVVAFGNAVDDLIKQTLENIVNDEKETLAWEREWINQRRQERIKESNGGYPESASESQRAAINTSHYDVYLSNEDGTKLKLKQV